MGPAEPGTPLYVHLPFCAAKCRYCDFFSVPDEGQDVDGMLDSILEEARARAPRSPRTVYLGGGTPSLLSEPQLARLLDELDRVSAFRASAVEVTAECNPESLDRAKAECLLELGVTRLSIGFQSLHDEVLALFGRVHSVEQSFAAFAAAREAGVRHVNVDLIYAAPGQTLEQWEQDLRRVLALRPEHLSAYNLTFEEETVFRRWLSEGRLVRHGEEQELELFHATRRLAAEAGYRAYEVSNFALPGEECLHNLNYWRNGTYVGLGPSAVSKVGTRRAGNVKGIAGYRRAIQAGGCALGWSEAPGALARLGETWWLGLRLDEGLAPSEALRRADWESGAEDPAEPIVARLSELGLLMRREDRFALSANGLPLADAVAREFLELGLGPP